MDIINISKLRTNLPRIIDEVSDYSKRLFISVSGKPKAVVLSLEDLQSLEETAEILSDTNAFRKIKIGIKQANKKRGKALKDLKI